MSKSYSISFKDVNFGFGKKQFLENFSFEAVGGKHTVLRGESGSGKSTILKLLLGFYSPASGTVLFGNEQLSPQSIRKKTAWLPQDLNLGSGTVQDVMTKPFEFGENKSRENIDRKLNETLQKLGMVPEILNKQFRDLSTGQRQRIGIATCYLLDKPVILLDEPTSSLDIQSKQRVADLILKNGTRTKTILSTSHDPFWVNYADNVIDIQ